MKALLFSASMAVAAVAATPANAVLDPGPLPANAFITFNGLDWAWASPCSPTGCSGGFDVLDLSFQPGWRLPTAAELAAGPTALDFLFPGANIPAFGADANGTTFTGNPGADGACAAAYFTVGYYNHCDFGDGSIGGVYGNPAYANEPNVETWLVRGGDVAVPEPASWALMIGGLGLVGGAMRRRRASVSFA